MPQKMTIQLTLENWRILYDSTMSPLFDQAIEDLIAQSLIHCEDGENFQITQDGINELENRKREAIPL